MVGEDLTKKFIEEHGDLIRSIIKKDHNENIDLTDSDLRGILRKSMLPYAKGIIHGTFQGKNISVNYAEYAKFKSELMARRHIRRLNSAFEFKYHTYKFLKIYKNE